MCSRSAATRSSTSSSRHAERLAERRERAFDQRQVVLQVIEQRGVEGVHVRHPSAGVSPGRRRGRSDLTRAVLHDKTARCTPLEGSAHDANPNGHRPAAPGPGLVATGCFESDCGGTVSGPVTLGTPDDQTVVDPNGSEATSTESETTATEGERRRPRPRPSRPRPRPPRAAARTSRREGLVRLDLRRLPHAGRRRHDRRRGPDPRRSAEPSDIEKQIENGGGAMPAGLLRATRPRPSRPTSRRSPAARPERAWILPPGLDPAAVRAVFLDLDGTVLDRPFRRPPRRSSAVAAARAAGIRCLIATGRMFASTRRIAESSASSTRSSATRARCSPTPSRRDPRAPPARRAPGARDPGRAGRARPGHEPLHRGPLIRGRVERRGAPLRRGRGRADRRRRRPGRPGSASRRRRS